MSEVAMLSTDVGAALELRDRANRWEAEPPSPQKVRELELLIVRAVQMASILQRAWPLCAQDGSAWETTQYTQRVRMIDFLAHTVVDILKQAQEIITSTRKNHPEWAVPPEAADVPIRLKEIEAVATQTRQLLAWLDRPRPRANEEKIQRVKESLGRGEGEAIGDILARLGNGGPLVKE